MQDLYSKIKMTSIVAPGSVAGTATVSTALIDTRDYESLVVAMQLGAIAGAGDTFAVTIMQGDADDGSDLVAFTDYERDNYVQHKNGDTGAIVIVQADQNGVFELGINERKHRYIRLDILHTIAGAAVPFAVTAIQGNPHSRPTK